MDVIVTIDASKLVVLAILVALALGLTVWVGVTAVREWWRHRRKRRR